MENMHTDVSVERVNTRPYSIGKSLLYEALFTDFHTFNPVPPKSNKDQLFLTIPLRYQKTGNDEISRMEYRLIHHQILKPQLFKINA